jgi:predicted neuraminidase
MLGLASLLVAICLDASGNSQSATATFHASSDSGLETALLPALYPSSHAANLLVLRNGDILCFWFSGSGEGQSDVGIVVSRLPLGSDAWEAPTLIDRQVGKSYQNPVAFQVSSGRIWLLHTAQSAGRGQADAQVLRVWSDDGGKTWTQPKVLFAKSGSFTRHPPIIMDDGTWLLPMYYTPSAGITEGAASNYSVVKLSKDSGKNWTECRIPGSSGLVQPSLVKVGPASYIAFFRSRFADWIYESRSTDGCAWAPPHPTVLPNNNSSMQAIRLSNGHLVIAFNNSSGPSSKREPQTGPRFPLSVALSEDDGRNWTRIRDIETGDAPSSATGTGVSHPSRKEMSYPSIVQTRDGRILVAYTYGRVAIKSALFSEQWLQAGTTTGQFRPIGEPGRSPDGADPWISEADRCRLTPPLHMIPSNALR